MSWINNNIQGATLPAGQFNKRDAPGPTLPPDAKRVRTDYGPPGRFNDKGGSDGPLGPLLSSGRNPGALTDAERLQSTQTSKTLAINTVRYFPSLRLPQLAGQDWIILNKIFMPNDIVFNLRCTEHMVAKKFCMGPATGASTLLLYSVNLATVNHMLTGLQLLLTRAFSNAMQQNPPNFNNRDGQGREPHIGRKKFIEDNFVKFASTDALLKHWYEFFTSLMYDTNGVAKTESFPEFMRAVFDELWVPTANSYTPTNPEEIPNNREEVPADDPNRQYHRFRSVLERVCFEFIFTYCRPIGVFVGSDRQGGEHLEAPNPAAFAPNDYVGVVQVAGKNISTCNMWMFSSNTKEMVCGGDELGFALKWLKYKAFDVVREEGRGDVWRTRNNETLQPFQLSSNPRTAVTDTAKVPNFSTPVANRDNDLARFWNEDLEFGIWLFTPCIYRCLLRKLLTGSGGKEQEFSTHFAKFCIANQMSRHMNVQCGDTRVATDAKCADKSLPLEVFLRFGHRKVQVPFMHTFRELGLRAVQGAAAQEGGMQNVRPGGANIANAMRSTAGPVAPPEAPAVAASAADPMPPKAPKATRVRVQSTKSDAGVRDVHATAGAEAESKN